jgi:imidazolonepropionase-like amidohydrolase
LEFVTLNPAKLLHIDDKVGSIKVGKDADSIMEYEPYQYMLKQRKQ